jgi:hypothetical protein
VTTRGQGDALRQLFPHLRVLVRPNGYNTVDIESLPPDRGQNKPDSSELRLVHYGSIHGQRVAFATIFERLVRSGNWSKITLYQYGPDWENALRSLPNDIKVEYRAPMSWSEVLGGADFFDAAIVIGWQNPAQMPSKTVQYLTLPIPRIAMSNPGEPDALVTYVEDKPGWAIVDAATNDAPAIIKAHLSRPWRATDLKAPEGESWEAVEGVLRDFALNMIEGSK